MINFYYAGAFESIFAEQKYHSSVVVVRDDLPVFCVRISDFDASYAINFLFLLVNISLTQIELR